MESRVAESWGGLLRVPHDGQRAESLLALLRLDWFIRLRWLFVGAATGALLVERLVCGPVHRPAALWVITGLVALSNGVWRGLADAKRDGAARFRPTRLACWQIALDLALLTGMVRYTGGSESPVAALYTYHMVIAALLLRPRQALAMALWATALYGGLLSAEAAGWLATHHPFDGGTAAAWIPTAGFLARKFIIVAVTVLGVLYFTVQIAARLEEREVHLRRANAALEASTCAMREVQRHRADFMRNAAHQLKSPLAGVQTLIGLFRDGVVPPGAARELYDRIERRCGDGLEQVARLLTLARAQDEPGQRDATVEVEIPSGVAAVVDSYRALAERKGITLSLSQDAVGAVCRLAPGDLRDSVGNLIDNALKYTPRGGRVLVEARVDDQRVQIAVRDNGPGVDAAELATLFEPYRRGNAAIAAGIAGSGLGLAIVRALCEQAGGSVRAANRPGGGAEFTIELPRLIDAGNFAQMRTFAQPNGGDLASERSAAASPPR
ncbi:MAG: HAMP domain-containing sensor histidine kinase [Phycisphaerae bacterium]